MGLTESRKYIQDLHRKQSNPYLWPDYLTGLPDKAAIIKKVEEVSPKLGEYYVAYVRIANIHPYLLKYGPHRHAEIIQWAAAILKTTSEKCANSFAGTLNTHDFIIVCKTRKMSGIIEECRTIFRKKVSAYYSKEDLAKGVALSFDRKDGETVNVGLMKLIAVIADRKPRGKKSQLILNMARTCDALEGTGEEVVIMENSMIQ